MGGSESRCCIDSEEKSFQECTAGYKPASNLQSPFRSASTRIVKMDPRSPSSRVDRTPIQVSVTPSGQPKPMMRVQPMIERESAEINSENTTPANDFADEAALLDPRSPFAPGSRTPIVESRRYDVMQDPRSPTVGIVRTPLLEESLTPPFCEGTELNVEGSGSTNWAICQTPHKHVYATIDISSKTSEEVFQGVFDPRSPSEGINRTPLGKLQEQDSVFSSDDANCQISHQFEVIKNMEDPRSPSEGIKRTPVKKSQDQEITSKRADDPRSPNAETPRTSLGVLFTGRHELRRTVLLSNALMASPLTKKVLQTGPSEEVNLYYDQAESTANRHFLDIPRANLGSVNESRSSSVIAVHGSDVDSLSNLDESIDENVESPILNVVDLTQDEGMSHVQIYGCLHKKQEGDGSSNLPQITQSHDNVKNVISYHMEECPIDALIRPSSSLANLDSKCGSSVDANERFVTAKFSTLSTDDEYLSSQEVNDPSDQLMSVASSSCDVDSPLFDEDTSANINFVTTYEILDGDRDTCSKSSGDVRTNSTDVKVNPNEDELQTPINATTLQSTDSADADLTEINVDVIEDEFQTPDNATTLPSTDPAECGMALVNGDNFVTPNNSPASWPTDNSHVGDNAVEVIADSVEETKQDQAWVVVLEDESHAGTSNGNNAVQSYLAIEDKISDRGSPEARKGSKKTLDKNSTSDSESRNEKSTPTAGNKKKPKRRLRTPKAVTRKHRHISMSTNALFTSEFDSEAAKFKSSSNSNVSGKGVNRKKTQISSELLNNQSASPRSPLALLTNDISKSCDGLARKNLSTTKLPRYRAAPKSASRSLSRSFVGQSAKLKTARNKEN